MRGYALWLGSLATMLIAAPRGTLPRPATVGRQATTSAPSLPVVPGVDAQPLLSQAKRVREALDLLGEPLPPESARLLKEAEATSDSAQASRLVQSALDRLCAAAVRIGARGDASGIVVSPEPPALVEQGWRIALVKVINEGGATTPLRARSPNARPIAESPAGDVESRWLDIGTFDASPLQLALSGLPLEYRIVQFYSRSAGRHVAELELTARPAPPAARPRQPRPDEPGWAGATITFRCLPSHAVKLRVQDADGSAATAAFVIRDGQGRVYPPQGKRLAPDLHFQAQVYRSDGETIRLPAGTYTITCSRGPETIPETRTLTVGSGQATFRYRVTRWVDPSRLGWWSGDHHIHAAGCAHYTNPTEGVLPRDMQRHIEGEDLKVGCNLTWGPCFDFQKQFFTGKTDAVSHYPYLLRYDIEVSGFGSHQSGHLCLLRLKEQIPPGGDSDKHWPTLCLNTLRWAKRQGAVCGPAHSANGLQSTAARVADGDGQNGLPTYLVPRFDGIGAMETIADVTHELPGPDGALVPAVDFISTMDTDRIAELNLWYHVLNCGYRPRISGETDFPCISGERVGKGRSYVKLAGRLDFDSWCEGVRQGRCYVSDGESHLMDYALSGLAVGERGSEVRLAAPGTVRVTARCAARWADGAGRGRPTQVEVVVNGYPAASQPLIADGKTRDVVLDLPIARSSWVALRVLGSSHTNPIFVVVGGKPIRASRRSAQWCLASVDQCWRQKERFIAPAEHEEAVRTYEHAREAYRRILAECGAE